MSQHQDRQLHFAEIEIGTEVSQKSAPIPPREAGASSSSTVPQRKDSPSLGYSGMGSYKSREQEFAEQARELAERIEEEAEFVPFMSYWPTYDHMSGLQRKWYFYWRSEVRAQRYPDTDLSYLFLYVYELLNGAGWTKPEEGCRLLSEIWLQYRGRYPKLDFYLTDWLADFVRVHQLDVSLLSLLFSHEPHRMSNDLLELELMERWREDVVRLPFKRLLRLLDYDVCGSKYYAGEGRRWLEEMLPKVVALADAYVRKEQGLSLLDKYPPEEPQFREKYLFRNAVYDSFLFGRTITVPCYRVSSQPSLRAWMTQLVRLTENKLRELTGARGRLRDIQVEPGLANIVERYLEREYHRVIKEEELRNRPAIVIDEGRLTQLQQDSQQVRDMLSTEEVEEASVPEREVQLEKHPAARENARSEDISNPWRTAAEDDPSQKESVMAQQEVQEAGDRLMLDHLKADEACGTQSEEHLMEQEKELEGAPWHEMDTPEDEQLLMPDAGPANESQLPEEWQTLAQLLGETELSVLAALVEGQDSAVINRIAEEQGSMPELLIDRINEAGMECLGDLLVDGYELVEEYVPMLESLTILYRRRR